MNTLLDLIQKATSPFHTVKITKERLKKEGFQELSFGDSWQIHKGGRYVVTPYGSSLFAFTVGTEMDIRDGFRIGAAHGDSPGFAVKPNPEIRRDGYVRLNVESYGGVNYMSWLDRPLSVAGKVVLQSGDILHPEVRLVDFKRPILTIPNVAVHMNRDMNKGKELKCQTHMLPLFACDREEDAFLDLLAKELEVSKEEILDFELRVYCAEQGILVGGKEEFLSSPRLDNLTSVDALLNGMINSKRKEGINLMVIFDHEEIGSRSKQGAAAAMLSMIMERISLALGYAKEEELKSFTDSIMLSVDVAHGFHPAYTDSYDPMVRCILNQGLAIKQASSQSYATDSELAGIIQQICQKQQIAYQKFFNHSDQKGGGTLGSIASVLVPIRTIDVGVPILAMHSSRELMGVKDQTSLRKLMQWFYTV